MPQPVRGGQAFALGSSGLRDVGVLVGLIAVTALVYEPAWSGTLLWDDAAHLTSPALQSLHGLWRIWFDPGATQQYYPLLHSAFWLQHRLWGEATPGYHLVNIVLHACSAFLVAVILRRLKIPGAWFAAAVFALHPVQVESVAWIAELKNTLSGFLGLAAVHAYLAFDQSREKRQYALAIVLFGLALASKTVTAMLPVMLLVALWWRDGTVSWRRHVVPLVPFLATGAATGLTTALIERTTIGATGAAYAFTFVERCLIAGRAFWFYLATLAWPSHLVFIYPRWNVSQSIAWQYVYPVAALALVVFAWAYRTRSRAPLAAILAFAAGLFPAIGFFNVYPFRYSFVADHFAYLAGIPLIALIAAGLARLSGVLSHRPLNRLVAVPAAAAVLVLLGFLTFRESRKYANPTVLYEATLRDNPSCWLAHVNLGIAIAETKGDLKQAMRHFEAALRLQPDLQEGHLNLGLAYQKLGRFEEAAANYEKSLGEGPEQAETYVALCAARRALGRLPEAKAACEHALALEPESAAGQFGLGATLRRMGDLERALPALASAARLAPEQGEIHAELGLVLLNLGRPEDAASAYQKALEVGPRSAESVANLGLALFQQGRTGEGMRLYEEAIRLDPTYVDARYYLGSALQSQGQLQQAIDQYRQVLAARPDAAVHNNLGLALEELGQPRDAATHYQEALRLRPDLVQAKENLARVTRLSGSGGAHAEGR